MIPKVMANILLFTLFLNSIVAQQLSGSVLYDGKAMPKIPKTQLKKLSNDPFCGSTHKEPVYRQGLIVNENKTLKNVLVYLKNIKYDHQIAKDTVILDQNGCLYSPRILGIMKNQKLQINNQDATLHNIHTLSKVNKAFNSGQPAGIPLYKRFKDVEAPFGVKCDVHPWMKAYISVFDHPYFSVTDDSGKYIIDNVPPGKYEVVAWHERDSKYKGYTKTQLVEIGEGGATLNFAFTKGKKK